MVLALACMCTNEPYVVVVFFPLIFVWLKTPLTCAVDTIFDDIDLHLRSHAYEKLEVLQSFCSKGA